MVLKDIDFKDPIEVEIFDLQIKEFKEYACLFDYPNLHTFGNEFIIEEKKKVKK